MANLSWQLDEEKAEVAAYEEALQQKEEDIRKYVEHAKANDRTTKRLKDEVADLEENTKTLEESIEKYKADVRKEAEATRKSKTEAERTAFPSEIDGRRFASG